MKWKQLKSVKIFEHPRLTLFEDEIELPSGRVTQYLHFGDMHDAGMVLAQRSDGKFLVQKEYSYPPNEVLFQLPGGGLESGEDPSVGAAREFAEEAGLAGDLSLLGWFYHNNRRSKQRMFVYMATNLVEARAEPDPEELFEDHWFTESEIDNMITKNEIRNYTMLAGWGIYKAKMTETK